MSGFFETDPYKLRNYITATRTRMEEQRALYEDEWLEIRKYIAPKVGKALSGGDESAAERDADILNSEPRILHNRLGAGLQSGVTNQIQRWFDLAAKSHTEEINRSRAAREWLANATERLFKEMANSNCYDALDRVYQHLGAVGTACMLVYDREDGVYCDVSDLGNYWIEENNRGRVNRVLRRMVLPAERMVEEFGERALSENIKWQEKTQGRFKYEVWNLVCPVVEGNALFADLDSSVMRYASFYYCGHNQLNHGICAIRGFGYNPIVAPRWAEVGGVYGHGPGNEALADAKTLQALERSKLLAIQGEVEPPLYAPARLRDDPVLENYPGAVVFGADSDMVQPGGRPVGRLFETRTNLTAIQAQIQEVERKLGRIFYADLMAMMLQLNAQPKQMTAREVSELNSEKVALLGPILTRLNTDLLDPLVTAYLHILALRGDEEMGLPIAPEELAGVEIGATYISAMHTEQRLLAKMRGVTSVVEVTGLVARIAPEVIDKIDGDAAIDEATSALPEAGAIVRDEKQVAKLRAERAAAMQKQQEQEQMMEMMKAAPGMAAAGRDLGEARVREGSMLSQIVNQEGGV